MTTLSLISLSVTPPTGYASSGQEPTGPVGAHSGAPAGHHSSAASEVLSDDALSLTADWSRAVEELGGFASAICCGQLQDTTVADKS